MGKAKFLSIQDEYCHFLQVTGQEEVSLRGWLRLLYSFTLSVSNRHLLRARHVPGSSGTWINTAAPRSWETKLYENHVHPQRPRSLEKPVDRRCVSPPMVLAGMQLVPQHVAQRAEHKLCFEPPLLPPGALVPGTTHLTKRGNLHRSHRWCSLSLWVVASVSRQGLGPRTVSRKHLGLCSDHPRRGPRALCPQEADLWGGTCHFR